MMTNVDFIVSHEMLHLYEKRPPPREAAPFGLGIHLQDYSTKRGRDMQ